MSIEELMVEVKALREDVAFLRRELQFGLPQEVYYPPVGQVDPALLPPGQISGVWCSAVGATR